MLGALIVLLLLFCAIAPQWIAPYDPLKFNYRATLLAPSWAHPFGTDNFGRDILSRVVWATRIDMQIALFATLFPRCSAPSWLRLVGYFGGLADALFRRLVNLIVTIPFLVLVIASVAVLGPGLINMYIAVSSVGWILYGRLMRGEIMAQRQRDYAAAGRVMGYGWARILFRHLLPNAISPVLVFWMTDMAWYPAGIELAIWGWAQPPTAEWGVLIADGKNFMTRPGGCRSSGAGDRAAGSGSVCSAMGWRRWCGGDDRAFE
jgi:peptide/nickel transport system permease protein